MKKAKGAEPRSEEEQYAALQKYIHKGKSVTAAKMKEFRRSATNKTGWNAAQVDAVIEEFVEAKWVITPWTLERELAQLARGATAKNTAETEHQMLKARVRHRMDENGSGTLSAAQFATLKDNLRGKTQTGLAVEAVVWELEREGMIEVEDVVRGRGGTDRRDWREEARVWAVQRGWEMPADTPVQGTSKKNLRTMQRFAPPWRCEGVPHGCAPLAYGASPLCGCLQETKATRGSYRGTS